MRFMITFNHVAGEWDRLTDAERGQHQEWLAKFVADLEAQKGAKLVFLSPPAQRKTVRKLRDGTVQVLDGPYLEADEQVGGYYIIEADSMEEAIEWGRRGRTLVGSNEVRQIFSAP